MSPYPGGDGGGGGAKDIRYGLVFNLQPDVASSEYFQGRGVYTLPVKGGALP